MYTSQDPPEDLHLQKMDDPNIIQQSIFSMDLIKAFYLTNLLHNRHQYYKYTEFIILYNFPYVLCKSFRIKFAKFWYHIIIIR